MFKDPILHLFLHDAKVLCPNYRFVNFIPGAVGDRFCDDEFLVHGL